MLSDMQPETKHCVASRRPAKLRCDKWICWPASGEEFAVLLSGTSLSSAVVVAERVRHAVAVTTFDVDGSSRQLTASIGVAQVLIGDETIDDAMGRADGALYRAKSAGRDCVISEG